MNRCLILVLLFAAGCTRPVPYPDVHPDGLVVTDHEMFEFIVDKCLEAQVDLYAVLTRPVPEPSGLRISGILTSPRNNGGPEFPEDFEANKKVSENRTLIAHFPPGTRFEVSEIIKVENPLDSPSYYYVAMLPIPGMESIGFHLRPLLNNVAYPVNPDPPMKRFADGDGHPLQDSIRYCHEEDELAVQPRTATGDGARD